MDTCDGDVLSLLRNGDVFDVGSCIEDNDFIDEMKVIQKKMIKDFLHDGYFEVHQNSV